MEPGGQLWQFGTLVVEPIQKGRGHAAEIKDRGGAVRARSEDDGTIKDEAGSVLLRAPLRKAHSPGDVAIDVADAEGRKLGEAGVAKYSLGPRSKTLTLTIQDAAGSEVARLEPRDKQGDEFGLSAAGSDVATVRVERVKVGLLRKSRVYTADLIAEVPEPVRSLAMAGLIRYEAMLKEVEGLSVRDRD
jgi:hypothetical protein